MPLRAKCDMNDWNELWCSIWLAEGHSRETYRDYSIEANARRYDSRTDLWEAAEARSALLEVDGMSVIDIGSGPGMMTLPMARRARRVTAVEPSGRMIDLLREHLEHEGMENVDIVNDRWEDVEDLEKHDVVVASLSLLMLDLRAAVEKMDTLARRRVHLIWFAGTSPWERIRMEIDPVLRGREYTPKPKADILYAVLHSMGIFPEVRMLDEHRRRTYASMDEAISEARRWLHLEKGHEEEIIRFLEGNLEEVHGGYAYRDGPKYALISWTPR
jgi:SAM-dependent methyltransferase